MTDRVFFALATAIWLPYGLYCFVRPEALAELAGVAAGGVTGRVELQAMYGGLQAGVGALMLVAFRRPVLRLPAYVALAFLCGGLGGARLVAAVAAGDTGPYTLGAVAFEWALTGFALWRLRAPEVQAAA